jgi:hypothetical protein
VEPLAVHSTELERSRQDRGRHSVLSIVLRV